MQNFVKHITEVKLRCFYIVFSFFCTFLTCYYFQIELLYLLIRPFLILNHKFLSTDVTEILTSLIYLCFIVSCILLIPFLLYQWWCFQKPSKYQWEIHSYIYIFLLILFCFELFCIYFYIIPKISAFFTSYQIVIHKDMIHSYSDYKVEKDMLHSDLLKIVEISPKLDTLLKYSLQFYTGFFFILQIPLVFTLCYQLQLINSMQLSKSRKLIIFFSFLFSAFVSPPDLFNQLICTIFFLILFEICILVGYFIESLNKYKNIQ